MCQILTAKVAVNDDAINEILGSRYIIKNILDEKGGESYSFTVYCKLLNTYKTYHVDSKNKFEETWKKFGIYIQALYDEVMDVFKPEDEDEFKENNFYFVFFSRQAPEMETKEVLSAPYTVNNKLVWMHGTIANISEIEKHLNIKFDVDSQALAYADELLKDGIIIEGVYTGYVINLNNGKFDTLYNGIGLWYVMRNNTYNIYAIEWMSTTPELLDLLTESEPQPLDPLPYYIDKNVDQKRKKILYAAFSGGMDIVLSLYTRLNLITSVDGNLDVNPSGETDINPDIVKLIYFDYGARARKQELETLEKYKKFLSDEFKNVRFETEVHQVKDLFNNLSNVAQYQSKLMTENSEGNIRETESNDAYVPYRNTEFALLIGTLIDRDLESDRFILPEIIYGLNLTEMSVYLDNSANWALTVNRLIMYGGKNYKFTKMITPFVNVTKTNMVAFIIKKFGFVKLKQLLDIAFSCYYPTSDNKPCGKCGSCILREKAISRAQEKLKMEIMENE